MHCIPGVLQERLVELWARAGQARCRGRESARLPHVLRHWALDCADPKPSQLHQPGRAKVSLRGLEQGLEQGLLSVGYSEGNCNSLSLL